jgi:Tfp pilus assembly protein PilE
MSKETLELTADEKAIIIAKREEEKAKGLLKQKTYEEKKASAKSYAQSQLNEWSTKNQAEVDAYEYYLEQLKSVNPNFKLVKTPIKNTRVVESLKLEYIDDEGYEIWRDADGNSIPSHIQKERHETLTAKGYSCHIHYTGELPEGCLYGVNVDYHETGSTYSKSGLYKMQLQGTHFDYNEQRRYYTNPKTVVTKILERIKWDFENIERNNTRLSLKDRALALATETYQNSVVRPSEKLYGRHSSSTYDVIEVRLTNDITVVLTFKETDDVISFKVDEVRGLTGKDSDVVIGGLSKISF